MYGWSQSKGPSKVELEQKINDFCSATLLKNVFVTIGLRSTDLYYDYNDLNIGSVVEPVQS